MNIKGTVIYGQLIRSSHSKELEIIQLEKKHKNRLFNILKAF